MLGDYPEGGSETSTLIKFYPTLGNRGDTDLVRVAIADLNECLPTLYSRCSESLPRTTIMGANRPSGPAVARVSYGLVAVDAFTQRHVRFNHSAPETGRSFHGPNPDIARHLL